MEADRERKKTHAHTERQRERDREAEGQIVCIERQIVRIERQGSHGPSSSLNLEQLALLLLMLPVRHAGSIFFLLALSLQLHCCQLSVGNRLHFHMNKSQTMA